MLDLREDVGDACKKYLCILQQCVGEVIELTNLMALEKAG